MCKCIKATWRWICGYWERVLFALVGLACLGFSFRYLYYDNITSASATFVVAFFSFIYANLARFKKFKGMGFEAELWEDKQKEAANLIDRLKNVVSIYTRETIINRVMLGRFGGGGNSWKGHWALYDNLMNQHGVLGQKIDFSDLKQDLDGIFIFDICSPLSSAVRNSIEEAKSKAVAAMNKEFGSPIKDAAGYNRKCEKLNAVEYDIDDMFERAKHENIAQLILDRAATAEKLLKRDFSIDPVFDPVVLEKLRKIAELHKRRPLEITNDIIALADR
ncbi:MAG: hypothetical protein JSR89_01555 [Proteobacteria bacterium]|nr:hypothetical protein [Pseudomonadota bacterium]